MKQNKRQSKQNLQSTAFSLFQTNMGSFINN